MSIEDRQISFYVDTMIVESLLCDNYLFKTAQSAGPLAGLMSSVRNYVSKQIDPNDRAGSFLNMFAPGIIAVTFGGFGMPWIGRFLGLAVRIFHINVAKIFSSIVSELKSILGGGKKTTPSQVDSIVHNAVLDAAPPTTEEEADQAAQTMQTHSITMMDVRITKLAMIQLDRLNRGLTKDAGILDWFSSKKTKHISLLSQVIGWIFKVALTSAGLMVAENVISHEIEKHKSPGATSPSVPVHTSTQTKFPVQPSYHDEQKNINGPWVENITNDEGSISQMLINFAKEVYQGLDGLDSVIESSPNFQAIKDRIVYFNKSSEGDPIVYIPKFNSKKHIVDYFIDDVAEKAP
jgi:hypothetical protein